MTEDYRTLELPEVRDPAIELAELRARVEALEAAQPHRLREPLHLTPEQEEEIAALLRPNHPAKPDSSLVKRVVVTIGRDGESARWDEARAAILEVALWLSENSGGTRAAWMLEQEAKR